MHDAFTNEGRDSEAARLATIAALLGPLLAARAWARENAFMCVGIVALGVVQWMEYGL